MDTAAVLVLDAWAVLLDSGDAVVRDALDVAIVVASEEVRDAVVPAEVSAELAMSVTVAIELMLGVRSNVAASNVCVVRCTRVGAIVDTSCVCSGVGSIKLEKKPPIGPSNSSAIARTVDATVVSMKRRCTSHDVREVCW